MSVFHSELLKLMPDLSRFARALTRNEDGAHDLVQDCVERALRKRGLFQDGTSLKSWLFTLMRNLFISQKRRDVLNRRYTAMLDDDVNRVQRAGQINTVFLKETMRAMGRLSKLERDAIIVLGVNEGSQHEMAESNAEPVGTVKSCLCRGRAHLRGLMGMDAAAMATA